MPELPRCATCRVTVASGQKVVFRTDGRVEHVACPEVVCPVCSRTVRPHDPIRRDREALLHGNCWIKRYRAVAKDADVATEPLARQPVVAKEPVKLVPCEPEADPVASLVRRKLQSGALPRIEVEKIWAGLGKGLPCSGCDRTITPAEIQHDVVGLNGLSALRFHRNCFSVWQREVQGLGRAIAGGSAASPWTLLFDLRVGSRAARDPDAWAEFRAATAEVRLSVVGMRAKSRSVVARSRAGRMERQAIA